MPMSSPQMTRIFGLPAPDMTPLCPFVRDLVLRVVARAVVLRDVDLRAFAERDFFVRDPAAARLAGAFPSVARRVTDLFFACCFAMVRFPQRWMGLGTSRLRLRA
jgi:hypothetical protein